MNDDHDVRPRWHLDVPARDERAQLPFEPVADDRPLHPASRPQTNPDVPDKVWNGTEGEQAPPRPPPTSVDGVEGVRLLQRGRSCQRPLRRRRLSRRRPPRRRMRERKPWSRARFRREGVARCFFMVKALYGAP